MKAKIEKTLNLLPEVTWDRWAGELGDKNGVGVFGWIARDDGKSDFVYLRIDNDGVWLVATSSEKHSADFLRRLGLKKTQRHQPCKRVEHYFQNVKAVKLPVVKG